MACEISLGRLEPCKDSVGGVDRLYFLNYQRYDITEAAGVVSEINEDDGTTPATAYEYVVRDNVNKLMQVGTSNNDNGTTFIEQTLTVQLKKITAVDNEELMLLMYGHPLVIVKDKNGKYWLAGKEWGCDVTTANSDTGAAMGDFNGYQLTIVGRERKLAPEVSQAAIDLLTIVTGS